MATSKTVLTQRREAREAQRNAQYASAVEREKTLADRQKAWFRAARAWGKAQGMDSDEEWDAAYEDAVAPYPLV